MKSKKIIFTIIVGLLLVPAFSMVVSLSHIELLANISNITWASWLLAFCVEIGSVFLFLALLFKLSSDNHKALAWLAFCVLGLVQLMGNTYAGFVHINEELAKNHAYLNNLLEITFNAVEPSLLKLIVSSIFGVLIVFLSLICMHFSLHLVEKYKNYHSEENDDTNGGDDESSYDDNENLDEEAEEEGNEDEGSDDENAEDRDLESHKALHEESFKGVAQNDNFPLPTTVDPDLHKKLVWVNPPLENISSKNYGDDGVVLKHEQINTLIFPDDKSNSDVKEPKAKRKYTKKNKEYWGDTDILPIVEEPVNISQPASSEVYKQTEMAFEPVSDTVNEPVKKVNQNKHRKPLSDVMVDTVTNNNP